MQKTQSVSTENIYRLEGRVPIGKAIPFGLQHILSMFVANIAPIIIVANACGLSSTQSAALIRSAMLIAGIGTLIQLFPLWKVGSGLPIVMGISFTFVSILCYIGAAYDYNTVVGASSFGGGSGSADFGSASNWILGLITLLCCILFNIFAKSFLKQLSVLFGLVVGYIVAIFMGKVDFSALAGVGIISLPQIMPFAPKFDINAIISVTLIFLVSATETIGDTSAVCSSGLGRDVTVKETSGSIACDGFVSSISSIFGCLPITSFSQNVGLVAMTKVVNRFTIGTGAVIMILSGIFPVLGAILATLPDAVLGGCTIMMFGTIVVSGLQMIGKCGFTQRNIVITALSLSIGLGFTQVPEIFSVFPSIVQNIFAENCVAVVFIVAVVLNLVLPKNMENETVQQTEKE